MLRVSLFHRFPCALAQKTSTRPRHNSVQSNLILIICNVDTKIMLSFPTADNKAWVAIFSWNNKGVVMRNDWPQHRASCQQWPVPMSAIFPRSASHSMLRMVGWVIFRLNVGAGAVRQHDIVWATVLHSLHQYWQESVNDKSLWNASSSAFTLTNGHLNTASLSGIWTLVLLDYESYEVVGFEEC